jgi:hypothetical protein
MVLPKRTAEPEDEFSEKRRQLINQDQNFRRALTTAIKNVKETVAGVTATVRIAR